MQWGTAVRERRNMTKQTAEMYFQLEEITPEKAREYVRSLGHGLQAGKR